MAKSSGMVCQGEPGEDAKAVPESQQAHLILMKEAALRS
jgi:hypothetical protein